MARKINKKNWKIKGNIAPPEKMAMWGPYNRRPKQHKKITKDKSLQGHRLGR